MNEEAREAIENAVSDIRASAILMIAASQDFDDDTPVQVMRNSWQNIGYEILDDCREIKEALGDEEEE